MEKNHLLEGKRILIVDDEPDVLETLADLLTICVVKTASTFDQAKTLLESQYFDIAILDIMGGRGIRIIKNMQREQGDWCDADRLCSDTRKYKNVIS